MTVDVNVTGIVVAAFQSYLGTADELPLDAELLADFGVDSLALVTILMDVAALLSLDLARAPGSLGDLLTVEDVAGVIATLVASR
jgi:acyl carrier protein